MILPYAEQLSNVGYTKLMRVIEPRQFESIKAEKKRHSTSKKGKRLIIILILLGVSCYGLSIRLDRSQPEKRQAQDEKATEDSATQSDEPKRLKTFSGEEFKKLYSSFAYPNTQMLTEKPAITGNKQADARIREIAESRGYKLSSVPVANIVKTGEPGLTDDDLIQPNALIAWQEMKAAAIKEGIVLQMTSAYRSVDAQMALFVRRMNNDGVYEESVAAGFVDDRVIKLLTRAAPPGYSRHHTGYTVDLACDGIGLDAFKTTSCYSWLSKNNYENTKKFGWVPSYPDGASLQGPEPEPWEFIWVSTYSLYE